MLMMLFFSNRNTDKIWPQYFQSHLKQAQGRLCLAFSTTHVRTHTQEPWDLPVEFSSCPMSCTQYSMCKPYTQGPPRSGGSTLFSSLSLLVHPVVGWPLGSQKCKRVAFLYILQSGFPCTTLCAIRLSSVSWHFKILFWQNVKYHLEATAEAGNWAERIKNINIYFI